MPYVFLARPSHSGREKPSLLRMPQMHAVTRRGVGKALGRHCQSTRNVLVLDLPQMLSIRLAESRRGIILIEVRIIPFRQLQMS